MVRIALIGNNGRRLKLTAAEAHKAITRGWARVADDDSQAAYDEYVAELDTESPDEPEDAEPDEPEADDEGAEPPHVLPPGYSYEGPNQGGWCTVRDPEGREVGKVQGEDAAITLAIEHHSEG